LELLLKKRGFDILQIESTFPIDLFLLMGETYIGNELLGRGCHSKRKTLEINLAGSGHNKVKRELYIAMAKLGIGREICAYARKLV